MSAEVKEDKREWLIHDNGEEPCHAYEDPWCAQQDLTTWSFDKTFKVVPASEKQRLQTLLDEACLILKKYEHLNQIDDHGVLRPIAHEFLGRVKK